MGRIRVPPTASTRAVTENWHFICFEEFKSVCGLFGRLFLIRQALSRTLETREETMNIEIRDAALEARIQKQLLATGSASVEEVLLRLLETQEEQDRWLLENREAINTKIRCGIDQLDRGEGVPEDRLDAYLAKLKAKPE